MATAEQTWVLTGAAGRIASTLRAGLAGQVARLRLVDVVPVPAAHEREETVVADVRDQRAMVAALAGAHGVLHLAGIADEADFHDLVDVNTVGTQHVFEAARRNGLDRVVYASSNHVTGFYPTNTVVDPAMPPRPDSFYAVSKAAGEALGQLYADKFALSVASVRIASFQERPQDERQLSTWLSPADCLAAFLAAMTAPGLTYSVFYAVSRNTRRWWDLSAGEALGFEPRDDAERYAANVHVAPSGQSDGRQGGEYASPAFTLARQR
ncbi:MAG TPA: NAD(P)-dependent oxidoreductase [Solirubrobacteraceae bacterium]|jgi:uronate dehydrogenase|nr:NAD(P)-dependent oxidoreductase [Solirubrobacteraceae bacterium]